MSIANIEKALRLCYRGMMASRRGTKVYRHVFAAARELEVALESALRAKRKGAK